MTPPAADAQSPSLPPSAGRAEAPREASPPPWNEPGSPGSPPRWERRVVAWVIAFSALLQANAILHHGVKGQDFDHNFNIVTRVAKDFREAFVLNSTNPPLFHVLDATILRLTGGIHTVEVIGFFNLLVSAAALWALHRLAREVVTCGVLRVALVTLAAFLPVRLIHGVVLAADALTVLPFLLLAWACLRLTREETPRRRVVLALQVALWLTVGLLTKFTFASALVAVVITLGQGWRRKAFGLGEAAWLLALAVGLPAAVMGWQIGPPGSMGARVGMHSDTPSAMSYRSLLLPHARDVHLLTAPAYDEPSQAAREATPERPVETRLAYNLLLENRFSYPGLVHLGIYTDPLNIFQYDPTDGYLGQRDAWHQRAMALAVKAAVPLTVLLFGTLVYQLALRLLPGLAFPSRNAPGTELLTLLCLGWWGNLIVFFPFIPDVYLGGYWLPRLILPALLVGFLLVVMTLDEMAARRGWKFVPPAFLAYVVVQSAIHISFLWPWGVM